MACGNIPCVSLNKSLILYDSTLLLTPDYCTEYWGTTSII